MAGKRCRTYHCARVGQVLTAHNSAACGAAIRIARLTGRGVRLDVDRCGAMTVGLRGIRQRRCRAQAVGPGCRRPRCRVDRAIERPHAGPRPLAWSQPLFKPGRDLRLRIVVTPQPAEDHGDPQQSQKLYERFHFCDLRSWLSRKESIRTTSMGPICGKSKNLVASPKRPFHSHRMASPFFIDAVGRAVSVLLKRENCRKHWNRAGHSAEAGPLQHLLLLSSALDTRAS